MAISRANVRHTFNDDWRQLCRDDDATSAVRHWREHSSWFERLEQPADALAAVQGVQDRALSRELLVIAGRCAVARRVLVQWMVPDVLRETNRQRVVYLAQGLEFDQAECDQLVVDALFRAVDDLAGLRREWPRLSLARRCVELVQQARDADWDWRFHTTLVGPDDEVSALDTSSTDKVWLRELVAELNASVRRGVIAPVDAEIVFATRAGEVPLGVVASRLNLSYAATQRRRHRAEAALQAANRLADAS